MQLMYLLLPLVVHMENAPEPIPRLPYDMILDNLRVLVNGIVDEDLPGGQLSTQCVVVFNSFLH